MKSYKEIAEALKGKQHKIDKNKNGKVDAHDFKLLRKEENELAEEATVKTAKYSWGTMKTVHHGKDFSIPLHPEHHQAISKLKDEQEHKFKDETGRHWVARRKGEHVHFDTTGNGSMKTHVPMHTMKEEYENEVITEEDHSELARKAAADYRKALARGDSVAANAANAEHVRHKKAAEVLRKKSHTPGEMDEETILEELDHYKEAEKHLDLAAKAKSKGDRFSHLMHMADHHGSMAEWHYSKGRDRVGDRHADKAAGHEMEAHAMKEEYIDESHVEFRIDHREKVSGDHKSTFTDHEAKVSDTTDKATYVKVPSHKADSFKSAMKAKHGARVELAEETVTDLNKYFDKIDMKGGAPKKAAPKKEPENTISGSQVKFLNTFREETDLNEKMNLAKADMGDVIKDFQKSDAPQFAGKTKEKKRQMAIAAKLEADRQQNEGVIQPSGTDAIDVGVDKPKDTVVRDKKGKLVSFKHEGVWKKSTGTVTDKGGAQHTAMSQARHLARSAMKAVKEEVEEIAESVFDDKEKAQDIASKLKTKHDDGNYSVIADHGKHRVVHAYHSDSRVKKDIAKLDEAFINGREYASHGLIHPDHAKMNLYQKTGNTIDFYHSKSGDKVPGKVTKNDGKEVHIRATNGDVHKFKVTSHLPQQNEGVNKSDVPAYLRKNDKLTTKDLEKERTQNRSHPETIKKINGTVQEAAPVAPVPGQKWKDHAVVVNGRQRLVIHRKNMGNYSKEDGWKEVAPGQKVKEDVDMDGNFVSEPMSYQEFAMMIESRAQYLVKATHNKTGRVKVSNYVADKDETEYGVRSRAEREHKPMGFSIDSVRKKDVEAHGEGDEEESTTKRGRGRPAGSKSGARGPRIK